jgi:hypothetical protein
MLNPVEQAFTTKVEQNAIYDETKADEKKKIDRLKNNSLAYNILMLSQNYIVTLRQNS